MLRPLSLGLVVLVASVSVYADNVSWAGLGAGGSGTSLDDAGSPGVAWGGVLPGGTDAAQFYVPDAGNYTYSTSTWAGSDSFTMWGGLNTTFAVQCQGTSTLSFNRMTITGGSFEVSTRQLTVSQNLANNSTLSAVHKGRIAVGGQFSNSGTLKMLPNSSGSGYDVTLTADSILNTGLVSTPGVNGGCAYLYLTAAGELRNSGTVRSYHMQLKAGDFINDSTGLVQTTYPYGGSSNDDFKCQVLTTTFLNRGTIDTGSLYVELYGAAPARNEGLIQVRGAVEPNALSFTRLENAATGTIQVIESPWYHSDPRLTFGTFVNAGTVEVKELSHRAWIRFSTITNNGTFKIDPDTALFTYDLTLLPGTGVYQPVEEGRFF